MDRVAGWRLLVAGFGERRDFERRIRAANGAGRVVYNLGLGVRALAFRVTAAGLIGGLVLTFGGPWGTGSRGWVGDQVGRVVRSLQNTGISSPPRSQ